VSIDPTSLTRRSFVYRELAALGADFAEINGAACALTCGAEVEAEADRAAALALCDLSPLPRGGFKGRAAIDWLRGQGVTVTDDDNRTARQDDGVLAARLGPGEVLLLGDLDARSDLCDRLAGAWSPDPDPGAYPVPRADTNCWFLVSGGDAPAMFAKLCGIDLRPHKFAPGAIAQTSVARLNAIVLRGDLGSTPAYHLLTDCASAAYMWGCLRDAMDEFAGAPVGIEAMRRLAASA